MVAARQAGIDHFPGSRRLDNTEPFVPSDLSAPIDALCPIVKFGVFEALQPK